MEIEIFICILRIGGGGIRDEKWTIKLEDINQSDFEDGEYYISSRSNKKVLSVVNANDGANVEVMVNSDDNNQWTLTKRDDYYIIKNKSTGKVLDVANAKYENLTNVWQFTFNGSCAQRWIFSENEDGTYTIHNYCNPTYVLDLQDGKTNVQIYSKTNYENKNQKWIIKKAVSREDYTGIYNILSASNRNKAMEVANNSTADGSNIKLSVANNSELQQWKVEKRDDYYIIRNVSTDKVLDVANAKYENLTNVWQFTFNGSCAQRWIFSENEDGTVTINNACERNYVLDLQDGKTNVQIYSKITSYVNNNQRWVLEER